MRLKLIKMSHFHAIRFLYVIKLNKPDISKMTAPPLSVFYIQ